LLDWETVSTKLPWGPVFILGGGYALADAFEVCNIHMYIHFDHRIKVKKCKSYKPNANFIIKQ